MDIDLSQFRNLDPNNIGSWPVAAKLLVILLLCAGVLFLGYYFDVRNQLDTLNSVERKESTLKQDFENKQAKAANLDAYKRQMREIEESFGTMLRQLPSKTEVADLLVDVTQTGLASGLEFDLFKPQGERPQDFYAELPIEVRVTGDYHQFGNFVSGVAALPRIVTLHNIGIKANEGGRLTMEATAKTYRYLDESEIEEAEPKPGRGGRRR